jgi:SagB-type dehydrogenase family enzyme
MTYGDNFQKMSKYKRSELLGRQLDFSKKPPLYKEYPANLERVRLEKPQMEGGLPLYNILQQRRSERSFSGKTIALSKLAQVLWSTQGITRTDQDHQFRTAPSAGALYPIETYCLINRVDQIKPGLYHYQVADHNLVLIKAGDYGDDLARAALGQKMMRDASFNLVWSAMIERSKWKYEQRAYRYIYLDAGHIGQNASLAAVSCGLGSCQIGAFFDDEVNEILEVDGTSETAIYLTAIGPVL